MSWQGHRGQRQTDNWMPGDLIREGMLDRLLRLPIRPRVEHPLEQTQVTMRGNYEWRFAPLRIKYATYDQATGTVNVVVQGGRVALSTGGFDVAATTLQIAAAATATTYWVYVDSTGTVTSATAQPAAGNIECGTVTTPASWPAAANLRGFVAEYDDLHKVDSAAANDCYVTLSDRNTYRWTGTAWEVLLSVADKRPWFSTGGGGGGGARFATVVVAANNSTADGKAAADYVCDGTNDQTEINNAITAIASIGGKVLLLEGTFVITNVINLVSNITLEGMGPGTVIQIDATTTAGTSTIDTYGMIKIYDTVSPLLAYHDIRIANLTLDANSWSGGGSVIYVATASSATGTPQTLTIEGVRFINLADYGIRLGYGGVKIWSKCVITGCTFEGAPGGYGVYLGALVTNVIITNNQFERSLQILAACDNVVISGNVFSGAEVVLDVAGAVAIAGNLFTGAGSYCYAVGDWVDVVGNQMDSTLAGINVQGNGGNIVGNVITNMVGDSGLEYNAIEAFGSGTPGGDLGLLIANNLCDGNSVGSGIKVQLTEYVSIVGNYCRDNQQHGICVLGTSHSLIANNHCYHNSQAGDGLYDNILVSQFDDGLGGTADSNYNCIQGNMCRAGSTTRPATGIHIGHSGSTGNLVINNDCYTGGSLAGIDNDGTSTEFGPGNRVNGGTWTTVPS